MFGVYICEAGLILAKTKSLQDAYDRLKQGCRENETALKRSKEACKKEIKTFRKELDDFLDNLEQSMLAELEQHISKECQRIKQHIETLNTALRMLETDHTLSEKASKDGRKENMFSAETRVSTNLRDFQSRLGDLEKNVFNIRLAFERNTALDDLQNDTKAFGSLKLSAKRVKMSKRTVLLGRRIQSSRKVNVRLADDKKDPYITGCVFMSNGYLLACDNNNDNIKLFDSSLSLQDSLQLSSAFFYVYVIDDNTVIVTILDQKQLQLIQVFPKLKLGHDLQLDKRCLGVDVSRQQICVSCHNVLKSDGEVRVLDRQGILKHQLGIREDGSCLFSWPNYITVSTAGDNIFVSDYETDTVTCMKVDGSIVYQYKDTDLKRPRGLYCDDGENVMVCGFNSNNIHVITSDGKKYGTLLSSQDGLEGPWCVAYRKSNDTLVVGCVSNEMIVCQSE